MGGKTSTKAAYFDKLKGLLEEYKSIFIVTVDNVSSQQMHEIRHSLRGEGVVLMGKNTMVSNVAFSPCLSPLIHYGSGSGHAIKGLLAELTVSRSDELSRASSVIFQNTNVSYHTSRVH